MKRLLVFLALAGLLPGMSRAQFIRPGSGNANLTVVTQVVATAMSELTNTWFGSMTISNAAVALETTATPVALTNWTHRGLALGVGVGLTNGLFYVTNAGRYLLQCQVAYETSTQPGDVEIQFYLDNQATGIQSHRDFTANGAHGSASILGLLNITNGQTVSVRVSSAASETLAFDDAQFIVTTFAGGGLTAEMGTNIANAVSLANDVGASNAYTVRILGSANVFTNAQAIQPLVAGPALTLRRATSTQTNDVQTWQAQDNSTLARLSSNGTFYATGYFSEPTQTAHATSLAVDASRDVFLDTTNTTSANVSILLTNCLPGTSGSLRLLSDATPRTISLFSGASLTPISTNATVAATNLITTASKHLLICYRVSRESPVKTNVLYWAIAQP